MLKFEQLSAICPESRARVFQDRPVLRLLYDSRKAMTSPDALFFAIRSERRDGHDFIPRLYAMGIRQFVVAHDWDSSGRFPEANFLFVPDVVRAMRQIAACHRNRFTFPVIGVTGSNGKTIVKEWLSVLLSGTFHIVKSPRSFNSQIGVPLSVWQMGEEHQLGIFEAGISRKGEMEKLEEIIRPGIGVVTNIGSAHDEGFTDTREKIREKLKLFRRSETLIYNSDQVELAEEIREAGIKNTFSWGRTGADLKIIRVTPGERSTLVDCERMGSRFQLEIPFRDAASVQNALTCVATLLYLGMDQRMIYEGVRDLRPLRMRLELKEGVNNCLLIDDAYNNDLAGLINALDFLDQQKGKSRKTVVLSDMLEYSASPDQLYETIAGIVRARSICRVVGIGEQLGRYAHLFSDDSVFFPSTDAFLEQMDIARFANELILVKGARVFQFERIVQWLTGRLHGTTLEINLDALSHNLNFFRSRLKPETRLMVMVKALAYGSGSAEVASLLQFHKVDYLGVAYADEGIRLRQEGISMPVMVMNPSLDVFHKMFQYNLEPEIYSFRLLQALSAINIPGDRKWLIHVKLDTGMHRLGFQEPELARLIDALCRHSDRIEVRSVFTHLAAADDPAFNSFTESQLDAFDNMASKIEAALGYKVIRHALNSAGIIRFAHRQMDMARLGIGLYGVDASGAYQQSLLPVSTLKTTISQIKVIAPGETVGYSRKGEVNKPTKIGTIAIGYADGYDRRFGNGVGEVLVNNTLCPVIGNVCMDMCMIDLTGVEAREGDPVVVFGEKPSITDCASAIGTIPYEILTGVGERVKRIFYTE